MKLGIKDITEYKKYETLVPVKNLPSGTVIYEGLNYGYGFAEYYFTNPPGFGGDKVVFSTTVEREDELFRYAGNVTVEEWEEARIKFLEAGIDGELNDNI